MLCSVDISNFILQILNSVFEVIYSCVLTLDDIIVFNAQSFGIGDFVVSLLDFNIGLVVISIVIGAFVHVNKADKFYGNGKS